MCGIIGLLARTPQMRSELGRYLTPMFVCMAARGPDSGGLAVFGEPTTHPSRRFSLYSRDRHFDWNALLDSLRSTYASHGGDGATIDGLENHAVMICAIEPSEFKAWFAANEPSVHVLSVGRSMDVYKDEGAPAEIAERFRFAQQKGTHCVGHTRMATESAVTPAHSHPFTAGEDFCLVHNGSLSNPYMIRRKLEREGLTFETDNDTEAACRYIEWRLQRGESLDEALRHAFRELDGFYTLLMATADQLTLVRDAFACKPAVVAETDQYVAIGSEFRSLAHLPDVKDADIFEPDPEEIYSWQV